MNKETIPNAKELLGEASTQVFINQILLAIVIKERCRLVIPVAEIDATGGYMLNMRIDESKKYVILEVEKKQ